MLTYLEETAHRFPSRIAISDDKSSLTFAEWENNSRSIATAISISTFQALRKPVLVFVDRSIECVVGFMGVMQSGNFYVPIDCKMPFERVRIISEVLSPIAAITVTKKDEQTLDQIDFNGIRLQYEEVIKTK